MKQDKFVLLIIFVVALLLRVWGIGQQPVSLYWDEASIGYEAFSISQSGKDMHGNSWLQPIFPAYGDYKAPMYIWLASVSIKLFGPTMFAVRAPSAFFGALTVLVMYWIARHLFASRKAGISAALLLLILPVHIQFSRTGFESNVAVFFIALTVLFLLKAEDKQKKWFMLAGLSAVSATYTYFSARIVVPLIALCLIPSYQSWKKHIALVVIYMSIFLLGLIPMYQSAHYDNANKIRLSTSNILDNKAAVEYTNTMRELDHNAVWSKFIHHRYLYMGRELALNMIKHFDAEYLFFVGDKNARHSTGYAGIMLPAMMPLFAVGIVSLLKNKPKQWWLLMALWGVFLIPASVPREVPHSLRSLNIVIPVTLVLAYAVKTMLKTKIGKKGLLIVAMGIVLNFTQYAYLLTKVYPQEAAIAWQDGYPQLAQYIQSEYGKYDYITIPPADRLFLYILFYGQFDPALVQSGDELEIKSFGKVTFKPVDWSQDRQGPSSSLIVGYPWDFPPDVKIKDSIVDSNGTVRFVTVDLNKQ